MNTAFGWISDFFNWILAFIPRLVIISAMEAGVAFVRGKNIKVWRPGIHFYWPVWTTYSVVATKQQMVNLSDQCVLTSDGKPVVIGGLVFYEVSEPEKLLGQVNDPLEYVAGLCLMVSKNVITEHTFDFIQHSQNELNSVFTETLQKKLSRLGVNVTEAAFSDLTTCKVLRISGIAPSNHTIENYAQ